MKISRIVVMAVLLVLGNMGVSAKLRCVPIYAFGVSASFNDSLVYFTSIQFIDSAWIDEKNHFLQYRQLYANQLRSYFNSKGQENRTCIFSFAMSEKDIKKKYDRMRRKFTYTKKKQRSLFDIQDLDSNDFTFTMISYDLTDQEVVVDEKARRKAEKVRAKQAKKAEKQKARSEKEEQKAEANEERPPLPPRR